MTKDEAIREIESQASCGVKGFQIISMDDDDVEMYGDDDLKERYAKMNDAQKEKLLSLLMDEIYDTFEQGDNWGFGDVMRDTLECLGDRRDEIISEAMQG